MRIKPPRIARSTTSSMYTHALSELEEPGKIRYNDFWVRVVAALVSGTIVVSAGEDLGFFELLAMPEAYTALLASMAMAFFVLLVLFRMNRWLDDKVHWFVQPIKRTLLQLLLCMLVPLTVAICCAAIYYGAYHYNLSQTYYFDRQFMPIVIMVLTANLYYMLQYVVRLLLLERNVRRQERLRLAAQLVEHEVVVPIQIAVSLPENSDSENNASSFTEKLTIPKAINLKEISYIYTRDRLVWAYYQGAEIDWPFNIKDSITALPEADFFCISKSCIVRRDAIDKAYHLLPRRAELLLTMPDDTNVIVAKNRKTRFTKWYGKTIYAPRNQKDGSPSL